MQPWKTRTRSVVLSQPPFLVVENHAVELPDGRIIPDWPWVITPDYINVVAETKEGLFVCFRQTKYGIEGTSLAIVGGYIEPGENPLAAAQRELLEETGYEATEWIDLGRYRVDASRGAGMGCFFLARQAYNVTAPNADDLEAQEILLLSRGEVMNGLLAGEFKAMAWTTAVALALLR